VLKSIIHKAAGDPQSINLKGLSNLYDKVCLFDSHESSNTRSVYKYSKLLAIGCAQEIVVPTPGNAIEEFENFFKRHKDWAFGYISYDLKEETENIPSASTDNIKFPLLHFFTPELVIEISAEKHVLHFNEKYISPEKVNEIYNIVFGSDQSVSKSPRPLMIQHRINRRDYVSAFSTLKEHIAKGDIYEVNFCQEFYAENAMIDPVETYKKLENISQAPFAAFGKFDDKYIISSSPERFIKKEGSKLSSQPIKGTIKRSLSHDEDEVLKNILKNDLKEQTENVMIVDLVRNDLSKVAVKGTVNVDELFGIHTFLQVHHMISTISCEIKPNVTFADILKATFPMGSMTGAPKVNAMRLIDKHEVVKRGPYSGALGYITPDGDFDFSVLIRSIFYNSSANYLSFSTGSAITSAAEAEKEYEECILKAKAMFEVLNRPAVTPHE
jgi:para-aminobenzoate synthetase component 1